MARAAILALALLCAGCMDSANVPGVTADPEQSAANAFPDIPSSTEAMQLAETGRKAFRGLGCESCHSITADRSGLMGPPLGGISDSVLARQDNDPLKARRWLVMHIKDPAKYPGAHVGDDAYRGTHMPPNPRVPDHDLRALVEFLWTLR